MNCGTNLKGEIHGQKKDPEFGIIKEIHTASISCDPGFHHVPGIRRPCQDDRWTNRRSKDDGVRRPDDLTALKTHLGFKLIYIDTPIATRFVRMKLRGEKSDDQSKTMEQFIEDHKLETELLIAGLKEYSDMVIDNSGTMKQLDQQLEQVLH